ELTVDHSRDQRSLTDVEEQVILALLKSNLLVAFRQKAAEFTQCFLRQNGSFFVTLLGLEPRDLVAVIAPVPGNGDQRQPVSIGGYQTHRMGLLADKGRGGESAHVFT